MRKNNTYCVAVINTRNELADALESGEAVIDIQGEAYDSILGEVKKEINSDRTSKKLDALVIGTSIASLFFGIGIVAITNLAAGVIFEYYRSKKDFSHYDLYLFQSEDKEKLLLINQKKYDAEYDSIVGYEEYLFTGKKRCPLCKRPIKNNELKESNYSIRCENCQKNIIYHAPTKKTRQKRVEK